MFTAGLSPFIKPWEIKGPKSLKLLRPEIEELPFTKVNFSKWDLVEKEAVQKAYLGKIAWIQAGSAAENSTF